MSALQQAKDANNGLDISFLNTFFWNWYHTHSNDRIVQRKIIVFTVTIRVRDLNPLFVMLFGQDGGAWVK